MTDFTSTSGNDDFVATSGPDRFYFGENQGVDLIVGFNPAQDKLVYTDRSVDGFDDIGISQLSNGDTAVESNDQVTVLQGIKPSQLQDADFVFTTSGPRYTIARARENNDVPNEVSVRDINQREARIAGSSSSGGSTTDNGSTAHSGSGTSGSGNSNSGGLLSSFLHKAGFGSGLGNAKVSQFGIGHNSPATASSYFSQPAQAGSSAASMITLNSERSLATILSNLENMLQR